MLSNNSKVERVEFESANIKSLPESVVQDLDRWMAGRFRSYVWRLSPDEADVDFVIARRGGEMIGRSAVVTRDVLVDGTPLRIMGIAGVIVKEEFQRQGLGLELMEKSMEFVRRNPAPFCILMCNRELGKLYEKFGFREIPGQNAVFDQPDGSRPEYKPQHGITMVYEKVGHTWPGGLLDLHGLPF
jgi:predicted N-acetyltransferase YhbS